jgi:hypothetical protein
MTATSALSALCAHVVEQVSVAKGRVRLSPFDRDAWFRCAYFSIQRTLPQGASQLSHAHLPGVLFDAIAALSQRPASADVFEQWVVDTIQELCAAYALSVGQAQRLINLLLTYHYCFYHAAIDGAWNAEHQWIVQHGPFFHVPIDHEALVRLSVTYACPDIHINREHTRAMLRVDHALASWSRLDDLPTYLKIQRFVHDIQDNHLQAFDTALHFALSELAVAP